MCLVDISFCSFNWKKSDAMKIRDNKQTSAQDTTHVVLSTNIYLWKKCFFTKFPKNLEFELNSPKYLTQMYNDQKIKFTVFWLQKKMKVTICRRINMATWNLIHKFCKLSYSTLLKSFWKLICIYLEHGLTLMILIHLIFIFDLYTIKFSFIFSTQVFHVVCKQPSNIRWKYIWTPTWTSNVSSNVKWHIFGAFFWVAAVG